MDMQTDRDELLARVASLYYEDGQTQQEISLKLGYSRSSISRMLTEARQAGIVEIHVHHPLERNSALEQRLQVEFSLREVRVLQGSDLPYPQMLRRLGREAGVAKVHAHRFRHTFATWAIENQARELDVQYLLGHSTPDMVRRYSATYNSENAARAPSCSARRIGWGNGWLTSHQQHNNQTY